MGNPYKVQIRIDPFQNFILEYSIFNDDPNVMSIGIALIRYGRLLSMKWRLVFFLFLC